VAKHDASSILDRGHLFLILSNLLLVVGSLPPEAFFLVDQLLVQDLVVFEGMPANSSLKVGLMGRHLLLETLHLIPELVHFLRVLLLELVDLFEVGILEFLDLFHVASL